MFLKVAECTLVSLGWPLKTKLNTSWIRIQGFQIDSKNMLNENKWCYVKNERANIIWECQWTMIVANAIIFMKGPCETLWFVQFCCCSCIIHWWCKNVTKSLWDSLNRYRPSIWPIHYVHSELLFNHNCNLLMSHDFGPSMMWVLDEISHQ